MKWPAQAGFLPHYTSLKKPEKSQELQKWRHDRVPESALGAILEDGMYVFFSALWKVMGSCKNQVHVGIRQT